MKTPKAFNMYLDSGCQFELLSDAQAGRLIKALILYANGEAPDLSDDLTLNVMFRAMSAQIERDFAKYREMCEKRSKAGKAGAKVTHSKPKPLANASKCWQEEDEEENKYEEEYKQENDDNDNEEYEEEAHSAAGCFESSHIMSDTAEVVCHLNQVAHADFKPGDYLIKYTVVKRLEEGYTADELITAVDNACLSLMESGYGVGMLPFSLFGCHQLPTANHQLPTTNHQLPTSNRLHHKIKRTSEDALCVCIIPARRGSWWRGR